MATSASTPTMGTVPSYEHWERMYNDLMKLTRKQLMAIAREEQIPTGSRGCKSQMVSAIVSTRRNRALGRPEPKGSPWRDYGSAVKR